MADTITFEAPGDGGPISGYALYLEVPDASPALVATAGAEVTFFTVPVTETALRSYRVATAGAGGEGALSEPVTNALVSITAEVPPEGATLRASNGEMVLALPSGSYAATTTVAVTEVDGSPRGGLISLAGVYEISPSGPLGAPATLSVAYTTAIEHFQVADAIVKSASLMTYDAASGDWVPGATGVSADATYLTGTLSHFSWWTGATIQPHGTSSTLYCSDGGICHNLSSYPDSVTRIAARDSQVCYNCHGSETLTGPPAGAPADSPNIAYVFEDSSFAHPVNQGAFTGTSGSSLYCVACHDPHADPTSSPGLLKARDAATGTYVQGGGNTAPGNAFCWTCHGAVNNKLVNYYVPGYFTASGGDKMTGFNGAHTALGTATWRWDSEAELKQGYTASTEARADGTVALAGTVMLPKGSATVTADPMPCYDPAFPQSPQPVYDGSVSSYASWRGVNIGAAGATTLNPKTGSATITIDLGSTTDVRSCEFIMYTNPGYSPGLVSTDTMTIQTSDDLETWQTFPTLGALGARLPDLFTIDASDSCRYVRFSFSRRFFTPTNEAVIFNEINIYGPPSQGTFEIWPDIARKATYAGGTLKWSAAVPTSASLAVTARASTDGGATWTGWQPMTSGSAISQIPVGASLEKARLQVRAVLSGVGATPSLDWLEVSMTRGAITGAVPQWTGDAPPANRCLGCHASHGAARPGLVTAESSPTCTRCHTASYGSSYAGPTAFATSAHATVPCDGCHTAHGKASGSGATYHFLLKNERPDVCLEVCHADSVGSKLSAKQGAASEWAKHDIYSAEQVKSGSALTCRSCHGTHVSSSGLVNPDTPAAAFGTMIDDPTSIPTDEAVIVASYDTLIDSTPGQETWNYGASTQMTVTQAARALLYFDLSTVNIPANAVIQNATLYLWRVGSSSSGSYRAYALTQDWLEGTGAGVANSADVNGATWLERRWGDNWAVPGGAYSSGTVATSSGMLALNVTTVTRSLFAGPNYGLILTDGGSATSIPFYTRDNATPEYRPTLRIVYQTGPATRQVVDDITFCNQCHDGTMALAKNVKGGYATGQHGSARGLGPGSDRFGYWAADRGDGGLKEPYSYGMDPLPCSTCHDPHGSRLPYHLRETINGQLTTGEPFSLPTGEPLYGYDWGYETATQAAGLGYFCSACHIIPTSHLGYTNSLSGCNGGCHNHAGK